MEPKDQDQLIHDSNGVGGNANNDGNIVILALDASESAEQAVQWYIDKIHRSGNKLIFVHCIELPEMKLNQARQMHMSPGVLASMWKEEEAKTKALEDKMRSLMKEKGCSGMLRTLTGKPGEVICRVAEEENADMIVTGQRGMGKVRRTILGSVSDYLVHHAHCPVIVALHPESCKKRRASISSRSRHGSGDSIRSRQQSGDSVRSRRLSGDSIRSRNTSGDCFRVRLGSLDDDDDGGCYEKSNATTSPTSPLTPTTEVVDA